MLRVSNVLNRYFKQKKILKYFSLPHGEYIIEYKKDDKIKTSRIKFNELDNINDIENKINEVIKCWWKVIKHYKSLLFFSRL